MLYYSFHALHEVCGANRESSMIKFRIAMDDRQRARTIEADSANDALAQAYGARFYSARHDSDSVRRDGTIDSSRYQINIQTGPTRHNSTPVAQRWATVTRL